jgi:hypothetical protein
MLRSGLLIKRRIWYTIVLGVDSELALCLQLEWRGMATWSMHGVEVS